MDVRLTDLEPKFLKIKDERTFSTDASIQDGDGLMFLCPKCYVGNSGKVGTHQVICWRPHVPQTMEPIPGRWEWKGTGFDDITLFAGSSSIQLIGGCGWHGFITNGMALNA